MQTLRLAETSVKNVINTAIKVLESGGLIIYPTETVYGVGVDATNQQAVDKLLRYKSRREGKPLSIAVTDQTMAEQYVSLSDQAKKLYQRFLPGPYTVVSQGKNKVVKGVESEFSTLGIRVPDYPLVTKLVKQFGKPITATSANSSGKKRPYKVQDVFDQLSTKQKSLVDLVIDAGELPRNEPSIVIDTTLATPLTIRGEIKADQVFETNSDQETQNLAGKLILKYWEQLKKAGLLIGLNGELGVGKTIFTQGIAQFLQIDEPISSPTYIYMNKYQYNRHNIRGKLHHLDLWKIDSEKSFRQLQAEKLLQPNNVVVVEWWQQATDYWPKNQQPDILINFKEIDKQRRKIAIVEKNHE